MQIAVEIDGNNLGFDEKSGTFVNKVEWSYMVLDGAGAAKTNGRRTADVALTPKNKEAVAEHGLRFATEIELPPGRYQFRVGGKEGIGGRTGSVFWDVDRPGLQQRIRVQHERHRADVVACGRGADDYRREDAQAVLPGPPTAQRTFTLEDTVAVYAEMYDSQAATPHIGRFERHGAHRRWHAGLQVGGDAESKDLAGARGGFGYLVRIPMQDLVPGRFVLAVEGRSRLGGIRSRRRRSFA